MSRIWVGALLGVLVSSPAFGQGLEPLAPLPGSGYAIGPDGGVSSWGDGSGYSVAPGVTSSWGPSGGYMIGPDGSVSSWSGPAVPVVVPDGRVVVVPLP